MTATLGGAAPEERDFVHAVYGNFGWVLLFVIVLTFILLDARVPLDRAACEGGDPEPDLARLRLRRRRVHLPAGPRQRGDLERPGDRRRDLVDPADDLRVPLRHLDGLRGVHDHAHPRVVRRDTRHRPGDLARARPHRQADHERRRRAHVRVLRALDRPGARHQAVRDRPRRRRDHRRDADPRCCSCRRRCSCSAAGTGGSRPGRRSCSAPRRARSSRRARRPRRRPTPENVGDRLQRGSSRHRFRNDTGSAGRRLEQAALRAPLPGRYAHPG